MSDEALRLLERLLPMAEYDPDATMTEEGQQVLIEARAFLAQPTAAREAVLESVLQDAIQCFGIAAWVVYARDTNPGTNRQEAKVALRMHNALADPSPAAAALLAREERLREALPVIVFALGYYDFGDDGITWERCVKAWEERFKPALQEEHGGDCTNDCYSCARCQAEEAVRVSAMLGAALAPGECICGLPEPAPSQHGFHCPKSESPSRD